MGLDIIAYRQLKPAPEARLDRDGYPVEWDRYRNITPSLIDMSAQFGADRVAGLTPGVYSFKDRLDFRAGSYGGYSAFRRELAVLGGWHSDEHCFDEKGCAPAGTTHAFGELVSFSDCEGVLGPVVSRKLLEDFRCHADRARGNGQVFQLLYGRWQSAFEYAADGGCVYFC